MVQYLILDCPIKPHIPSPLLSVAARFKHMEMVRMIIDSFSSNENSLASLERDCLLQAFSGNHYHLAVALISEFDIDPFLIADDNSNTMLHVAASNGYLALVHYLVEKCGLNPNAENMQSQTPVQQAFDSRNMPVVMYFFLECKTKFVCDSLLLRLVVTYNLLGSVYNLLNTDCNESTCKFIARRLLGKACESGHDNVIRDIVAEYGVDVFKSVEQLAISSLHAAIQNGHLSVVKLLIEEFGLNPNCKISCKISTSCSCHLKTFLCSGIPYQVRPH